jgi:hypothetical protein
MQLPREDKCTHAFMMMLHEHLLGRATIPRPARPMSINYCFLTLFRNDSR